MVNLIAMAVCGSVILIRGGTAIRWLRQPAPEGSGESWEP